MYNIHDQIGNVDEFFLVEGKQNPAKDLSHQGRYPTNKVTRSFQVLSLDDRASHMDVTDGERATGNEHWGRENEKWEQIKPFKPNLNPSPISNLIFSSLFCSHFSFSHSPLSAPSFSNIPCHT